jgi:hypothetical protein
MTDGEPGVGLAVLLGRLWIGTGIGIRWGYRARRLAHLRHK